MNALRNLLTARAESAMLTQLATHVPVHALQRGDAEPTPDILAFDLSNQKTIELADRLFLATVEQQGMPMSSRDIRDLYLRNLHAATTMHGIAIHMLSNPGPVQLLFNATGITPGLFVDLAEGSMHNLPDESHLDDDQGAQWETEAGDEGYGEEATGNPFGSSAAYAEATGYPFDQYLPPDEPTSPRPAETAPVRGIPSPDDLEAFFELVKAKAKARFPDVPQGAELNISVEF